MFEVPIESGRSAFLFRYYISGEIRYVLFYNQGTNQIQKNPENPFGPNQIELNEEWPATSYRVNNLGETQ
jgi:hypothetical protein